jgi:hypothetical protein
MLRSSVERFGDAKNIKELNIIFKNKIALFSRPKYKK